MCSANQDWSPDPDSLTTALDGLRAMFLLSGYKDMPALLERARQAGVRQVVLLSGSSAGARDLDNAISRYMLASETAVVDCGLDWTILRPVSFMSNALQWVPQLRRGDAVRAAFADVRVAAIDPLDIASVAAEALLSGKHNGRVYPLTGPESLLPADRVHILGQVLGRALRFVAQSDAEAREEMAAATPGPLPAKLRTSGAELFDYDIFRFETLFHNQPGCTGGKRTCAYA